MAGIFLQRQKTHYFTVKESKIFDEHFDFWPKFRFLAQISIFDKNFHFWPKFQFLTKISIFDESFYFRPKFRYLGFLA